MFFNLFLSFFNFKEKYIFLRINIIFKIFFKENQALSLKLQTCQRELRNIRSEIEETLDKGNRQTILLNKRIKELENDIIVKEVNLNKSNF